jgi:50S ribosomal subunit-associated GTPase HflX
LASSDDIFLDTTIYDIPTLEKTWMAKLNSNVVFVSAQKDRNIQKLKDLIRLNIDYLKDS